VAIKEFLLRSSSGIDHFLRHERTGPFIWSPGRTRTTFIDFNKAQANHNDGWNADKTMRRAASIPGIIRQKWILEEGWDCALEENWDKLRQKLNSSDWRYLRTADWRL
jgi:hypothetical protein